MRPFSCSEEAFSSTSFGGPRLPVSLKLAIHELTLAVDSGPFERASSLSARLRVLSSGQTARYLAQCWPDIYRTDEKNSIRPALASRGGPLPMACRRLLYGTRVKRLGQPSIGHLKGAVPGKGPLVWQPLRTDTS